MQTFLNYKIKFHFAIYSFETKESKLICFVTILRVAKPNTAQPPPIMSQCGIFVSSAQQKCNKRRFGKN